MLGLGLGGGVAYAAGTFDGDEGPTDAELAAAEAKIDAAAEANEAAQQDEPAPVQERVVEVHHVHHDHPHHHHHAPTAQSPDVEVMGYSRITDGEGGYIDRVDVKVGDQEAALFDTNGDGIADEMRMDVNHDGQFAGNNEIINLHEQGYEIPMREFAQEIGFDYDNVTGAYADANGYHLVEEWNGMLGNDDGGDVADNDFGGGEEGDILIDGDGDDVDGVDGDEGDVFVEEGGDDDFAIVEDEGEFIEEDVDGTMVDDEPGISDDVAELGGTEDDVEIVGDQDVAMDDSDVMMVDMDEAPEEELMAMDDSQDFDNSGEIELTDDAPAADDLLADNSMPADEPVDDMSFDSGMI